MLVEQRLAVQLTERVPLGSERIADFPYPRIVAHLGQFKGAF